MSAQQSNYVSTGSSRKYTSTTFYKWMYSITASSYTSITYSSKYYENKVSGQTTGSKTTVYFTIYNSYYSSNVIQGAIPSGGFYYATYKTISYYANNGFATLTYESRAVNNGGGGKFTYSSQFNYINGSIKSSFGYVTTTNGYTTSYTTTNIISYYW